MVKMSFSLFYLETLVGAFVGSFNQQFLIQIYRFGPGSLWLKRLYRKDTEPLYHFL